MVRSKEGLDIVDNPIEAGVAGGPKRHTDAVEVPVDAIWAADEIASSSGQRTAAPIRKSFVRVEQPGDVPPMAAVYAGGRSGLVALKLYLALIWRCSSSPYETDKPARAWATLLGLPDPETKGARRVSAALKTLAAHNLIAITPQEGRPNITHLLDESGDRTAYITPGDAYRQAMQSKDASGLARNLYFKIDQKLWLEGEIQSLRGPGLVMLLILLAEQGGEGKRVWFSTEIFHARYRISHKTRAAGTQELMKRGILIVEKEPLHPDRESVFGDRRYRSVYRLKGAALGGRTLAEDLEEWSLSTTASRRRRKVTSSS